MRSYEGALHAMQTGVALVMENDPTETSPKHLRVGVNSALCDSAALARLLVEKGIISKEEYAEAIRKEMNAEVERYRQLIKRRFGIDTELV